MIVFPPAPGFTIPALQRFVETLPPPYSATHVAEQVVAGKALMVTVVQQGGSGPFDTLAYQSVRVNVYASDSSQAASLMASVVGFMVGPFRDGKPVVDSVVNAGPIQVTSEAGKHRWYAVVDLTIRGVQQ